MNPDISRSKVAARIRDNSRYLFGGFAAAAGMGIGTGKGETRFPVSWAFFLSVG